MRIFLSYASERRAVAEPIAFALRGRGHDVFLDKSDLPLAGNYDAQIEDAIRRSDLMVFLISPESVSRERFTLTELAFARKKWRSARERVIPVMIAPTPIDEVPAYLTSVHIMHPEGNAAAELASFVDGLTPIAEPGRILPAALVMGAASGLVSSFKIPAPLVLTLQSGSLVLTNDFEMEALREPLRIVSIVLLQSFSDGFYPAAYAFTLTLVGLLVFWDNKTILRALWVFPITVAAWAAAFWLAFYIHFHFQEGEQTSAPLANQCIPSPSSDSENGSERSRHELCVEIDKYREQIAPLMSRLNWLVATVAGVLPGFVGSLLLIVGLGRVSARLQSLDAVVLVTCVGTVAGALLNPRLIVEDFGYFAQVLFVIWQAGVAMAIAWQFTKRPR